MVPAPTINDLEIATCYWLSVFLAVAGVWWFFGFGWSCFIGAFLFALVALALQKMQRERKDQWSKGESLPDSRPPYPGK